MLTGSEIEIAYWHWMILGIGLAVAEIFLFSFVALWFGISAFIVGILLWIVPLSLGMQLSIWIVLSILTVYFWFKLFSPHLKRQGLSNVLEEQALIGQIGLVIDNHLAEEGKGVLRFSVPILEREEWSFSCHDKVEVGQRVIVDKIVGDELQVSVK